MRPVIVISIVSIDAFESTASEAGYYGSFTVSLSQVNLDFESEEDMVEKFRIGLALQPIASALFASSPFKEGKPTG